MIAKIKADCMKANYNEPGTLEHLAFESGYYYGECISLSYEIENLKQIINEQKSIINTRKQVSEKD